MTSPRLANVNTDIEIEALIAEVVFVVPTYRYEALRNVLQENKTLKFLKLQITLKWLTLFN